jgi:hypothetical protein
LITHAKHAECPAHVINVPRHADIAPTFGKVASDVIYQVQPAPRGGEGAHFEAREAEEAVEAAQRVQSALPQAQALQPKQGRHAPWRLQRTTRIQPQLAQARHANKLLHFGWGSLLHQSSCHKKQEETSLAYHLHALAIVE